MDTVIELIIQFTYLVVTTPLPSSRLDETSRKQPRPPRPLQRALVPAVVPFLVDVNQVVLLQLQLVLAVRRVRDLAPEKLMHGLHARFGAVAGVQGVGLAVVVDVRAGGGAPGGILRSIMVLA